MPRLVVVFLFTILSCGCSPTDKAAATHSPVTTADSTPDATPSEPQPIDPNKHIVMAADPWCPHNCVAGAEKEGYMVEIAREALASEGYTLEYKNRSWARALEMVGKGQIDAVVGAFKTDAPDLIFPEVPQGHAAIRLYTNPESDWTYDTIDSLAEQTLLVLNSYSYTAELDAYIEKHGADQSKVWIISGPSPLKRALSLLAQDHTDVFAEDAAVMTWAISNNPSITQPRTAGEVSTTRSYVAFSPARKDAEQLAQLLSEGTRRLVDSGRASAILDRYGLSSLLETP